MAKQPIFKLYRICDRQSGKAFSAWGVRCEAIFTPLGNFFRSPETIRKHLTLLTHEVVGGWYGAPYYQEGPEIPGEIDRYYVEVYTVLELTKHVAEAREYLGKERKAA